MKAKSIEIFLQTAGGKIICLRCQAHSKRTKVQCGAPAEKGKKVCRFHGARSTGAKTKEGRLRIAHGKTQRGNETCKVRAERSATSAELASIEDIMHLIGMTTAPRTRGRKASSYKPITSLDAAFEYMARHPITS
jgi:hypothetical protein